MYRISDIWSKPGDDGPVCVLSKFGEVGQRIQAENSPRIWAPLNIW